MIDLVNLDQIGVREEEMLSFKEGLFNCLKLATVEIRVLALQLGSRFVGGFPSKYKHEFKN